MSLEATDGPSTTAVLSSVRLVEIIDTLGDRMFKLDPPEMVLLVHAENWGLAILTLAWSAPFGDRLALESA